MSAVRHHTVPYFDRFADAVPDFPAAPWWWGCTCGAAVGPFGTEDMARAAGRQHERDMARETAEAELADPLEAATDKAETDAWHAEIDAIVAEGQRRMRQDDLAHLRGIGDAIAAAHEPLDRDAVREAARTVDLDEFERRMSAALSSHRHPYLGPRTRVCRPRRATR